MKSYFAGQFSAMKDSAMGVYEPITAYLCRTQGRSVRLTFGQVERIIKRPLPRSAYRYREWWSNNPTGHSHARSWTAVGWRTQKVNLEKRELVFSKLSDALGAPPSKPAQEIPDPFGSMRGSVTFFPGVDLTEPTGEEWAAERGSDE
jgi:hypothetical protein